MRPWLPTAPWLPTPPHRVATGEAELESVEEELGAERLQHPDLHWFFPVQSPKGSLTPESGYKQAKILLSQENRPTAIFAGNDQMAFGAIYAAIEMGLRVPEDIGVIGFDNIPLSSFFVPPLSTIAVPMSSLGSDSMETLVGLIAEEQVSRIKLHETKLIVRKSTLNN